jgi:hypothetical protein
LRMPLKRLTPSFTVEYRQAKRPKSGSAKPSWAHARPAPAGLDEKADRIATSAFKTVAPKPPADLISPPIPTGRVLPSLVAPAPMTARATQMPAEGAVARQLGDNLYSSESLEPSVATIFRLEPPTTSRRSAGEATTPRSKKRTRRPPEKQGKLDDASRKSAEGREPAPVSSASVLPPVAKPSSATRTSRILDRYVFRDERGPGESWKRRIEARRERRA